MRVPLYRQLENNDCGPTCIQMISAFYGKKYSLKGLKELCSMTRLGISLRDIVQCCKEIGMDASSVNINIGETRRMPLPAILYYPKGHFVVLEKIKKRGNGFQYRLVDPEHGRIILDEEKLQERWMTNDRGLAVVMRPVEGFEEVRREKEEKEGTSKRILLLATSIFKKYRKSFICILFLTLFVVVMNWAMPLLLQKTIDDGIMQKSMQVVWMMLLAQLCFFLGFMISGNINGLLNAKMGFKINIDFISGYFNKVIKLPMEFFDTRFRSDLIQRLGDQSRINEFVTENIMGIGFTLLNLVVFSGIMIYFNYKIFLIFLFFNILLFSYNAFFLKKRKYLDYSTFTIDSERRNVIYELIMGMPEIKINNAQNTRIHIWRKLEDRMNKLKLESIYLNYYMTNGAGLIVRLRDIVITAICAFYVIQDHLTIGTMMMISFVLGQLTAPLEKLVGFITTFQDARLSYDRLAEIYDRPDENDGSKIKITEEELYKGIQLKNVSFKYAGSTSPYVLQDINLSIPYGKKTAIVGASGSGKTTLLKLLLGFYYPASGDLYLGNKRIHEIDFTSWRERCGVVMQDGYVFSGSFVENIALSDEKPDIERLVYATKIARIDEHIKKLPMGYHTRIGETGIGLSGGEKQRMYIARAVYRNPDFIFFDEATSSLDATNEKEIMHNLEAFYENKTVVVIAHRLSTVKNADNIVFMDKGRIVEQGTHRELVEKRGAYFELVRDQLELAE